MRQTSGRGKPLRTETNPLPVLLQKSCCSPSASPSRIVTGSFQRWCAATATSRKFSLGQFFFLEPLPGCIQSPGQGPFFSDPPSGTPGEKSGFHKKEGGHRGSAEDVGDCRPISFRVFR